MTTQKPTRIRFAELDEELQEMLYKLATHMHRENIVYPATQEDFYELSTDANPENNPSPGEGRIRFIDLDLSGSPQLQNLLSGGISSVPATVKGEVMRWLGSSNTAPNGTQTQYECEYQILPNSEIVFIQGVRQQRGVDYNVTANVVTFTTAPPENPFDPARPILIDYEPMSPAIPISLPRYLVSETPILTGVGANRTYSLLLTPTQEGLTAGDGTLTQNPDLIQQPLVIEQVYHLGNRLTRGIDYTLSTVGTTRNVIVNNSYTSAIIVDYQPAAASQKLILTTGAMTTGSVGIVSFVAANQVKINKSALPDSTYDYNTNSIQIYYNGKRLRAGAALDYTISYTSGSPDLFINFHPTNVSPPISTVTQVNNLIIDFQLANTSASTNYKYFTVSEQIVKPIPAQDVIVNLSVPTGTSIVNAASKLPQIWTSKDGRIKNDGTLYTVDFTNKRVRFLQAGIPTLFGSNNAIRVTIDYQVTIP